MRGKTKNERELKNSSTLTLRQIRSSALSLLPFFITTSVSDKNKGVEELRAWMSQMIQDAKGGFKAENKHHFLSTKDEE